MNRAAADLMTRPVAGRVHLRPNGAHLLEVSFGYGREILISTDELTRLEKAIAAFRAETTFEDGRTVERTHPCIKPLGEF